MNRFKTKTTSRQNTEIEKRNTILEEQKNKIDFLMTVFQEKNEGEKTSSKPSPPS